MSLQKPYAEAIQDPEILIADFAKFSTPRQLHFAFQALDKFRAENNRNPVPYNKDDADKILSLTSKIAGANEELDSNLIRLFSYICDGDLCPMNGVIGGIAAQEAIKSCTGKFMPIQQWFYFDSVESLPDGGEHLTEKDCVPVSIRTLLNVCSCD